jgi:nicotinamidase-related amidase
VGEALLIIDFQNDFTPGGALPVEHGDEIADRINELAASGRYDLVIATRDWHPADHWSFAAQGGPWPIHCVQDSPGAQFHPALNQGRSTRSSTPGRRPTSRATPPSRRPIWRSSSTTAASRRSRSSGSPPTTA